ncbi:MAG TPA: ATP-binding protein [Candidatus Binataceae bacterium]|nr:ATP-binding protein [Candidatus Binataceae bacterium]
MRTTPRSSRCRVSKTTTRRQPSDLPIQASAEEIESIRKALGGIEKFLVPLFDHAYSRSRESLAARATIAELIDEEFSAIVEQWRTSIESIFSGTSPTRRPAAQIGAELGNALLRFRDHLRDPDDIRTYIHLRRHCQEGMLSRAEPSQFNGVHIALKQIILSRITPERYGKRREHLRNTVVAAIDERRLMVSQFYVESREKALRLSEEKYRNSINHAPDPMYEIDPESWIVTSANSAAERLHDRMPGNGDARLVGHTIAELSPADGLPQLTRHLRTVVHNGFDQIRDLAIGGRYFDVNSALIPFGEYNFIQLILHDVSQRREMLDELLKAERLAAVGTFAAGVAHEVNNPLASISSLVQSLLTSEDDPTRRSTLHTILTQITRISGTLKDLVNFARPSTAHRQAVDLNALIEETLRLVSYNKRFSGITLKPELAPDLTPAHVDNNEVQQVLLNLLFNAADAVPSEGATIRIVTENFKPEAGPRVRKVKMKVIDNGIGIPREHLERVFDPFFTTKPAGAGTGLGLSLCQRIVLGNHGTIKVESEVGQGTAVTIYLPAYVAETEVEGETLNA